MADVLFKKHKTVVKSKLSWWKVALIACFVAGVLAVAGISVFLFLPDTFINNYIRNRIINEFKSSNPGYSIEISELTVNIFKKSIELGTVAITSKDSLISCNIARSYLRGIGFWQIIWKRGLSPEALANSVVEAQEMNLKFHKQQYEVKFRKINITLNDSVIITNDMEIHPLVDDNKFFGNSEFRRTRYHIVLAQLQIKGLAFLKLLEGKLCHARFIKFNDAKVDALVDMYKPIEEDTIKNSKPDGYLDSLKEKINIDSIISSNLLINYAETNSEGAEPAFGYEIMSKSFDISVKDSTVRANDIEIHPLMDDKTFFAESKFRKTSFKMRIHNFNINGLACSELFSGKSYTARNIIISDASFDILADMYKPCKIDKEKNLMPNELFKSIKENINVDSFKVSNSQIKYCESYSPNGKPAVISFDNFHFLAKGISNNNNRGDTVVIRANAQFMNSGIMTGVLFVPLTSEKFSLHYYGSISTMDLKKLNTFIEIAEHKRIKSGLIEKGSFDIQVKDGHSTGYVKAAYKDFKLALLDPKTGSEMGVMNKIKSFLANTFKLHGTNEKDDAGILKLGKVQWVRKHDDNFTSFAWFSLRSGIANIVGF